MKGTKAAAGVLVLCLVAAGGEAPRPPAVFEGEDTLLVPEGYREWVFVGSSLGLRYDPDEKKPGRPDQTFKHVYIDPAAFREYRRTGKFPEGTVLVLEVFAREAKREPGLQGSFAGGRVGLSAAVKDGKRFKDGWAYFGFDGGGEKVKPKAKPFARESCWDCHHEKGEEDNVFTQFYPILRDARPGAKE